MTHTSERQGLAGLSAKWRKHADKERAHSCNKEWPDWVRYEYAARAYSFRACAEELDAAIEALGAGGEDRPNHPAIAAAPQPQTTAAQEPVAWEWDYGQLDSGCLDFPIWIAWDNGSVDYVDEGATVDFAGCVGWMRAAPPQYPENNNA